MASQQTTIESPAAPSNEPPQDPPTPPKEEEEDGPRKIAQVYSYLTTLTDSGAKWGDKQVVSHQSSGAITDEDEDTETKEAESSNEELLDDAEGIPPSPHVRTLSGIKYGEESPKQSLDLYYPGDYISRHHDDDDDDDTNNEKNEEFVNKTSLLPVFIHIHGGGWSRGNKANSFYGAPSVCRTMASAGCLSIAIGYRLGAYPHFMEDTSLAIHWIYNNVYKLGGDKNNMFLAGHSAGGHIASLLMVRHDSFLKPYDIPTDFIRGMVLLSGVYDLFDPLKKAPIDVKNKWFYAAYVLPAFGRDEKLRYENSPLLLLDPDAKKNVSTVNLRDNIKKTVPPPPSGKISLPSPPAVLPSKAVVPSSLAIDRSNVKGVAQLPKSAVEKLKKKLSVEESGGEGNGGDEEDKNMSDQKDETSTQTKDEKESVVTSSDKKESATTTNDISSKNKDSKDPTNKESQQVIVNTSLPPTLIMNATIDMGLEENGELMNKAMSKYTDVTYVRVPRTDHASICWDAKAAEEMKAFVKSQYHKPSQAEVDGERYEIVDDEPFWSCTSY